MLSSLFHAFALFDQAVRHVLRGNPSHFKVRRKFYMCFFITMALPRRYAPYVYFPLSPSVPYFYEHNRSHWRKIYPLNLRQASSVYQPYIKIDIHIWKHVWISAEYPLIYMQSLIDFKSFAIKLWWKIKFKTMNIDVVNVTIDHWVTS